MFMNMRKMGERVLILLIILFTIIFVESIKHKYFSNQSEGTYLIGDQSEIQSV